jgi:hypothetical protein
MTDATAVVMVGCDDGFYNLPPSKATHMYVMHAPDVGWQMRRPSPADLLLLRHAPRTQKLQSLLKQYRMKTAPSIPR